MYNNGTFVPDSNVTPQRVTPFDGDTVRMSGPVLYLTPAGPVATVLVYPPARMYRGQTAVVMSTQPITSSLAFIGTGIPAGVLAAYTKVTILNAGVPAGLWKVIK